MNDLCCIWAHQSPCHPLHLHLRVPSAKMLRRLLSFAAACLRVHQEFAMKLHKASPGPRGSVTMSGWAEKACTPVCSGTDYSSAPIAFHSMMSDERLSCGQHARCARNGSDPSPLLSLGEKSATKHLQPFYNVYIICSSHANAASKKVWVDFEIRSRRSVWI